MIFCPKRLGYFFLSQEVPWFFVPKGCVIFFVLRGCVICFGHERLHDFCSVQTTEGTPLGPGNKLRRKKWGSVKQELIGTLIRISYSIAAQPSPTKKMLYKVSYLFTNVKVYWQQLTKEKNGQFRKTEQHNTTQQYFKEQHNNSVFIRTAYVMALHCLSVQYVESMWGLQCVTWVSQDWAVWQPNLTECSRVYTVNCVWCSL